MRPRRRFGTGWVKPILEKLPTDNRLSLKPLPDPFPIRREFVPDARLKSILEETRTGSLIRMPRDEFEQHVRAAGRQSATRPATLIEGRYTATLNDNGLQGEAAWRFSKAVGTPGLVRLEPLQVSLGDAHWNDDSPAFLFHPHDAKVGVVEVVPQLSGELHAAWSVRGIDEPSAQRFRFALPSAPVSILSLELPADRHPSVSSPQQLLTGPMPGADANHRRWNLALGTQSEIELTIRRGRPVNQPPAMLQAHRQTELEIEPDVARVRIEFDLQRLRGQPDELLFEVDPGLRILGITGDGRFTWQRDGQNEARIRVANLDSGTTDRLVFTGLADADLSGQPWRVPTVRLLDALPGRDRIRVTIDPRVEFVDCSTQEYQLDSLASEPEFRLNLVGQPLPDNDLPRDRRQPSLRLGHAGARFRSENALVWNLRPGRPTLQGEFRIRVERGPLVTIPIRIPKGYDVRSVELLPDDVGLSWSVSPHDRTLLNVTPGQPLTHDATRTCMVKLLGPPLPAAPDPANRDWPQRTLEIPRFTLESAAQQRGNFTIQPAPAYHVSGTDLTIADQAAGWSLPIVDQNPRGRIELQVRRPELVADTDTRLSLLGNELVIRSKVRIDCLGGEAGQLTLSVPDRGTTTIEQTNAEIVPLTETITLANRLTALASPMLAAISRTEIVESGACWRVVFAQPLRGMTTLQVETRLLNLDAGPIRLPLPKVIGAVMRPAKVRGEPSVANAYRIVPIDRDGGTTEFQLEAVDPRTADQEQSQGANIHNPRLADRCRFNRSATLHLHAESRDAQRRSAATPLAGGGPGRQRDGGRTSCRSVGPRRYRS